MARFAVDRDRALPSPAAGECKDPKSLIWPVVPSEREGGPLAVDESPDCRHQRSVQALQHVLRHVLHQGEDRTLRVGTLIRHPACGRHRMPPSPDRGGRHHAHRVSAADD